MTHTFRIRHLIRGCLNRQSLIWNCRMGGVQPGIITLSDSFFYNGQYILDQEATAKDHMLYGHVHNGPDEQKIREYLKDVRKHPKWNCVLKREDETPCQINCFCMFSDYIPLDTGRVDCGEPNRYRNQ